MKEKVCLKVGAKVMCTANIDMTSLLQIVNGSQGIIQAITQNGCPLVKFNNGRTHEIKPHAIMSENMPGLTVKQVPLILSWAITTHKSQGITLDSAIIDAGTSNFEFGQIYVALSRVKSLEGLYLTSLDYTKIKADPRVITYYDSLITSPIIDMKVE